MGAVVSRRKRREPIETGDPQRMDHRMRAACQHDVGLSATDDHHSFADGLGACGTCGKAASCVSAGARQERKVSGGQVRLLFEFLQRMHAAESDIRPDRPVHFVFVVVPRLG